MASPGERIGNWHLVRKLGAGATAKVWLAHADGDPEDLAAVKIIRPHSFENARARFEREAKILRTLRHPSIVGFRDSGELPDRQQFYLVMDYVDGADLADRIGEGAMPADDVRRLFRDLASGLDHAHARGIYHRDLKPQNVMVRNDGRGILIDFGIALEEGGVALTREGMLPGTVGYFPPEVFERGTRPDPRMGDIYALGLLLYETLEGRLAFAPDAEMSTNQQAIRIIAEKMELKKLEYTTEVPYDLRQLVDVATHPDPTLRLVSMSVFLDRLGGRSAAPRRSRRRSGLTASQTVWFEANSTDDEIDAATELMAPPPIAPLDEPGTAPPVVSPSVTLFTNLPTYDEITAATDHPAVETPAPPTTGFGGRPPAPPPPPRVATATVSKAPPSIVPSPVPSPPDEDERAPAWPPWVRLAVVAAAGVGGVMLALVVVVVAWSGIGTKAPEDVLPEVVEPVVGALVLTLGEGAADRVVLDGQPIDWSKGNASIEGLSPGEHTIVLGAGACEGQPMCGACCTCREHEVVVAAGPPVAITLDGPVPPEAAPRAVHVGLDGDIGRARASVTIGDGSATEADGVWIREVVSGRDPVELVVEIGTCTTEDAGCGEAGTCPDGCWSARQEVEVRCGVEPVVVNVPVQAPTTAEQTTGGSTPPEPRDPVRDPSPRDPGTKVPDDGEPTVPEDNVNEKPQVLSVAASAKTVQGNTDAGAIRAAMGRLTNELKACWERTGAPYSSLGRVTLEFKVKRDGSIDASSLAVLAKTGVGTVDGCVTSRVKSAALPMGQKPGKAQATFTFTVK